MQEKLPLWPELQHQHGGRVFRRASQLHLTVSSCSKASNDTCTSHIKQLLRESRPVEIATQDMYVRWLSNGPPVKAWLVDRQCMCPHHLPCLVGIPRAEPLMRAHNMQVPDSAEGGASCAVDFESLSASWPIGSRVADSPGVDCAMSMWKKSDNVEQVPQRNIAAPCLTG